MKTAAAPRPFTGYHMMGVIALFFGTIITVNLILAYHAVTSWSGLVVQNSYVESQKFNEKLAERRHQDALGLASHISMERKELSFRLDSRDGQAVELADVFVMAFHRKFAPRGLPLTLSRAGAGFAAGGDFAAGQWRLDVSAIMADGGHFEKSYKVTVK